MAGVDMTWVRRAVKLAEQNAAAGQLPFGAVVVRAGEELATGVNTALRDHDPAAHAEVEAVRNACRALGALHLTGAVIYSSCEPCDMCRAVATNAGISTVYYAALGADIPDLHYPAPPVTGVLTVEHTPADGSSAPFERYLAR
jgi:guanine deaminase